MSETSPTAATPDTLTSALFLDVAFSFEQHWTIEPEGAQFVRFPPGGGLAGPTIEIGPVNFEGLSAEQINALIARRAGDMALISKAIAVANTQFSDALAAIGFGSGQ